jgi:hypothetical protein
MPDDDKRDTDKPTILTGDKNMSAEEMERITSGEQYQITPQQLMELAKMAKETYDLFVQEIKPCMTVPRALRIKELRKDLSWRALADTTYREWGQDACWGPPSNQLAGMALTKLAAEALGEKEEDWNIGGLPN